MKRTKTSTRDVPQILAQLPCRARMGDQRRLYAGRCEKSDETVSLYQNADDCSRANPSMSEQCTTPTTTPCKKRRKPRRNTPPAKTASPSSAKRSTQAPAQAGMAAESQSSGSSDAADGGLHDGPPDGRFRLRAAATVHFQNAASPANGKFVDASGKSLGPAPPAYHDGAENRHGAKACGHQHRDPRWFRRDRGQSRPACSAAAPLPTPALAAWAVDA